MNVYFCDVCGVRVTDLDLHSGHGMRRRNDVICAACLELGHGKGWVANHAQKQQMAFAGAGAAMGISATANAVAEHESMAPSAKHPTPIPALEMARDRLRTLDDDHPPQAVPPVQLDAALADLELSPAPPSLDEPVTTDDTAKVQVLHQELSTAAAGFAALTPPLATTAAAEPEDDLQEAHNARLDDSGAAAILNDHAATPEQELDAEKAETASNSPVESGTAVTVESKRKPSPSPSRTATRGRANTASSSSKVSKASKSSKSRPIRRVKPGIPPIMLISVAGIALIVLIGVVVISSANNRSKGTPTMIASKINTDLVNLKKDALVAVAEAIGSKDMGKLDAAKVKIRAVREKAAEFEKAATDAHWTEEQINDWMERNELSDLYQQVRTINDQEDILKQQDASH